MTDPVLLRFFANEDDRFGRQPLVDAVVEQARAAGIAGATVLKAIGGFAGKGAVHSSRAIDALPGLPVLVEVVDDRTRIADFIARIRSMNVGGLLTVERIEIAGNPER